MKSLIRNLRVLKETSGPDMIEYALIAGLIAIVAIAIMPGLVTSSSAIVFPKPGGLK